MDDLDRRIIELLAEDARRSLADISGAVGLSPSTVNERIRRLGASEERPVNARVIGASNRDIRARAERGHHSVRDRRQTERVGRSGERSVA